VKRWEMGLNYAFWPMVVLVMAMVGVFFACVDVSSTRVQGDRAPIFPRTYGAGCSNCGM